MLIGGNTEQEVRNLLPRMAHRGPDDAHIVSLGSMALGFVRLEINGTRNSGKQPYRYGNLVGAFNGEIYNSQHLTNTYQLTDIGTDTHTILPLFSKFPSKVLELLDGFYSGVIVNEVTGEIWCMRGHMGKKPLFVGQSNSKIFITSELKVFDNIEFFYPVPLGITSINPQTGELHQIAQHSFNKVKQNLKTIFRESVVKRLPPPSQPVGVFLSGGLDSSLVAAVVAEHRPDAIYFTLGNGQDNAAVQTVIDCLGLRDVRVVPLPDQKDLPNFIRDVVYFTESFNPSVISNGLGTFLLSQAAKSAGIKVVLGGEGADELFGGYHQYKSPQSEWRSIRNQLISDMPLTELRRLDLTSMAHSIEVRCPFLDHRVRSFSDTLEFGDLYGQAHNKVYLRREFKGVLPDDILWRPKTSLDVGSGVRGLITPFLRRNGKSEREGLMEIWKDLYSFDLNRPYFSAYPVFDEAIENRGVSHK
mgnify:CR=1 FL=1|jgi:asparagine synthase (glutamine-hydrolysing)